MPPHGLNLKFASIIMLMRNMNIRLGFCNGNRLRVIRLHRHFIHACLLDGSKEIFIHRIPMTNTETGYPFKLTRLHFPVRLAYAVTINKSQGQTLDRVGIFLQHGVFDHGQLYVAYSRARS
jgi:ATP-dependent DNA helicase PIF1